MLHRLRAIAGPLFGLTLFATAVVLLVREAQQISWDDFITGLTGVPRLYLAFAALLVAMNYCLLMTYDLLALRYVRRALPLRRVALVGFLGYALGNNLGTLAAATPLRFRLYTSWGVPPRQVMAIVILLGLTFWSGLCWLGGTVLLAVPVPLPADIRLPLSTRALGAVLLSVGILYALACFFWRRPLPIRTLHVRPPTPGLMGLQTSVASLDLAISAIALYLVLPPQAVVPFALVLAAYLVGLAASLLTQVPGGLVVLELVLLKLLQDSAGKSVIGSLLIFRLMYYIAPLIIAAIVLGIYEMMRAYGNRRGRPAAK